MRSIFTALALILPAGGLAQAEAPAIYYTVTDLRNDDGSVRCALYAEEDGWLEGDPPASAVAKVEDRRAVCVFRGVESGVYAIAAMHDEDDDQEMDKNFLGIPEEGHAASRNAQEGELKPDWVDAKFAYTKGTVLKLKARIEY